MKALVCVDFSPVTDQVIQAARMVACAPDSYLRIVHVQPKPESYSHVYHEAGGEKSRVSFRVEQSRLERIDDALAKEGVPHDVALVFGGVVETIVSEASGMHADLIVMGFLGQGALHHLVMGSVAEGVMRKTRLPVLLVPQPGRIVDGHE